jgi:hypothetical protein
MRDAPAFDAVVLRPGVEADMRGDEYASGLLEERRPLGCVCSGHLDGENDQALVQRLLKPGRSARAAGRLWETRLGACILC